MNKIINGVASEYKIPNVKSLLIDNERKQITDIYNEENHSVIATKLYSLEKQIESKDKEIDRLNKECDTYMKIATKRGNIINELEKWLNKVLEIYINVDIKTLLMVKDKLKELKEGNK